MVTLKLGIPGFFLGILLSSTGQFVDETIMRDPNGFMTECKNEQDSLYDSVYEFTTLDNRTENISSYYGNVLLVINYRDFNPLLEKYGSRGLRILAFPTNQFHMQEPGENWEILNGLKYVRPGGGWEPHKFLKIFGKTECNGKHEHPMYRMLKAQCEGPTDEIGSLEYMFWSPVRQNDITWNFEKFLVDKRGRPRYRFNPRDWANGTVVEPFIQKLLDEEENSKGNGTSGKNDFVARDDQVTLADNFVKFFQLLTSGSAKKQ